MLKTVLTLSAAAILFTGCSFQRFGSPLMGHTLSEGASRADVLANLGEPDSIFQHNDTEVMVYKTYEGSTWAFFFSEIKRTDHVVVIDENGSVLMVQQVEAGNAQSVMLPPYGDFFAPVKSAELTESAENYSYEFGGE